MGTAEGLVFFFSPRADFSHVLYLERIWILSSSTTLRVSWADLLSSSFPGAPVGQKHPTATHHPDSGVCQGKKDTSSR